MTYPGVPFDAMAGHLLTVDDARGELARTEVRDRVQFSCGESELDVTFGKGWDEAELTGAAPVWLTTPDHHTFALTFQAAQQLGSTCHINRGYQRMIPPDLLADQVRWWLREGLAGHDLQLFLGEETAEGPDEGTRVPVAVAQARAAVIPYSNTEFLDTALDRLRAAYGEEAAASALVDYKFNDDLEHTVCRVVVPAHQQVITGTGEPDDAWCTGVEFTNSAIGSKQTTVTGYLFRFVCTNGARDIAHSAGGLKRRGTSPEQAMEWMAEAVDDVLGRLEPAFDRVRALTKIEVRPDTVTVLKDLFKQFGIPKAQALRVTETLADVGGDMTMYELLNAVTRAANLTDLEYRPVAQLLAAGGHMIHSVGARCEGQLEHGCRRMLPKDWDAPDEEQEPEPVLAAAG
jgi:hypothetical protein